jgi:hypothetical protein
VEDYYNFKSFGDLNEEISKLIKPEPMSSEASFGLYCRRLHQELRVAFLHRRNERKHRLGQPKQSKSEQLSRIGAKIESQRTSQIKLVTFRATATRIADVYLEDRLTPHNRSAGSTVIRDRSAYNQGVRIVERSMCTKTE